MEIKIGNSPLLDAEVNCIIHTPTGNTKLQLYDVTKSSGIYKRYFSTSETGLYKFEIFANDNGQSYIQDNYSKQIGETKLSSFQIYNL